MTADWFTRLRDRFGEWREALAEAERRDEADAARWRKEGYTLDGCWITPDGNDVFDGPSSHVSVLKHLEDVAKERDLIGDIQVIKDLLRPGRKK